MREMYKSSLQMIKKIERIPTELEWNSIAKENCLMSCTTLEYIEKISFKKICKRVRRAK